MTAATHCPKCGKELATSSGGGLTLTIPCGRCGATVTATTKEQPTVTTRIIDAVCLAFAVVALLYCGSGCSTAAGIADALKDDHATVDLTVKTSIPAIGLVQEVTLHRSNPATQPVKP